MRVVDKDLLVEFRAKPRCEYCGRATTQCEAHHLFARGMGGGGRLDIRRNLIALCWECHRLHHDGHRPLRCDLLAVVAAREGCQQQDIIDEVHRLRRTPK